MNWRLAAVAGSRPWAGPSAGSPVSLAAPSGAYCTMVLSDLGARVVKVETPDGGDDLPGVTATLEGVLAPPSRLFGLTQIEIRAGGEALEPEPRAVRGTVSALGGRISTITDPVAGRATLIRLDLSPSA